MGRVFRARDPRLDRDVAIKLLPAAFVADPDRLHRFEQEARAASALNHPNILSVYDVGTVTVADQSSGAPVGAPFLVTELLEGRTLRDLIANAKDAVIPAGGPNPLPWKTAMNCALAVGQGLVAAHARGIIHRDLKPDNLFITQDGHVKILDFGLAKLTSSNPETTVAGTQSGVILGTVGYMAPEQVRGERADHRSDLFAFGAVLYEMFSGRRAFTGTSAIETLHSILTTDPPSLAAAEGLPEGVDAVVRRCLAKQPDQRFQSARDLVSALQAVQSGDAVDQTTWRVDPSRPLDRPSRRLRTGWKKRWWIGGVAAVLVFAIGLWAVSGRRAEGGIGIGAGGRPAVAIAPFETGGGPTDITWLRTGLPNMLVTGLAQTPGLDVISSERISEALGTNSASAEGGDVLKAARRVGAGALISGGIFHQGAQFRVDARVQDASTGRVLAAHTISGPDVFPLADDLAGRVRASLNLDALSGERPVAQVTSESLEAFRAYSAGVDAEQNTRFDDAAREYRKAAAIDPGFAAAYLRLAYVMFNLGDAAAERESRAKLRAHFHRLSDRDRGLAEAEDAAFLGNPADAAQRLEALLKRYPDEALAYQMLEAIYEEDFRDVQKAVAVSERAVRALPTSGGIRNSYGYLLLRAGRVDDAIREFEEYARLEPDEPNPADSLAEARLIAGDPKRALVEYQNILDRTPTWDNARLGLLWAFAILGDFDNATAQARTLGQSSRLMFDAASRVPIYLSSRVGRYREADGRIESDLARARANNDFTEQADLLLLAAWHRLELGQPDAALPHLSALADIDPQNLDTRVREYFEMVLRALRGVAHARSGGVAKAEADLKQLQERKYSAYGVLWLRAALEAELLLAKGDAAAAETVFRSAEPTGKMFFSVSFPPALFANHFFQDGIARARERRGDLTGAIKSLQELGTPSKSNKWTRMVQPLEVWQSARLFERIGDRVSAQREYRRFLQLWKNADESLPQLNDARRALERLSKTP